MDILRNWARCKPLLAHVMFLGEDGAHSISPSHGSLPNELPEETWYETYELPFPRKDFYAKIDKDGPRIAGRVRAPLTQAKSLPPTDSLPPAALLTFLQIPPKVGDVNSVRPSLKLVKITKDKKNNRFHFNMTRGILTSLLDTIKADPWAMWLISSQYDGFHHMRANKTYNDTFYFGCWNSAIAWTFCRQSASTRAIWITRQGISEHRNWDMDDKRNPIPEFLTSLDSYAPLIHVPYVLAIALALATMLDYDARILRQLQQIEEVEEGTGFTRKHMVSGNLDHACDMDKWTQWSRLCSGLRINTTNLLRHHDNCMRLFEYIADSEKEGPNLAAGTTYSGEYDRSMADILEMTRVLKMRADSFSTYASYIRDRAEAQVNVVCKQAPLALNSWYVATA